MKYLFIVFSLFASSNLIGQDDWKWFYATDHNFKILSPIELKQKTKKIATDLGTMAQSTFFHRIVAPDSSETVFVVSTIDYPKDLFPKDSTDLISELLFTSVDELKESMSASVLYNQADIFKGHPARIAKMTFNEGKSMIKLKYILIKDKLYCIEVFTGSDAGAKALIDRFLESFDYLG